MMDFSKHLDYDIMNHCRHQFIYGYNGEDRKQFLKKMVDNYPVALDSNNPVSIYLNNISLPKIISSLKLDKIMLLTLSREYFNFSIITSIIDITLKQVDVKDLSKRAIKLLEGMNSLYLKDNDLKVVTLQELRDMLRKIQNVYKEVYQKYNSSGKISSDIIGQLPITFIDLNLFIRYYKEMLGHKSFIGLVIDQQTPICLKSQQVINGLIGSRINKYISMKVACEPSEWETHVDLNGTYIENVHDYGIVEFDNSYKEHLKKLKSKRTLIY